MNLHVIIGEDDYLVAETARKIIGDGVGLETIDSLNSTNAELQLRDLAVADSSFSTPPFLDPKKVTWWKNVHFLPGGGKKSAAEDVKLALERFAEKLAKNPLPENQHFILSGPKLLATSIFAKTLKTAAEMVVFASARPWEAADAALGRMMEMAGEMGLKFVSGAAERFVARVGTDTRSLKSELEKMRDYLGAETRTVTPADIAAITSQGVGVEPEIWAITDSIGRRDLAATLAAVRPFEGENGFAVLVTSVVEKFFRQLAEMKDAQARGRLADATAGMAPFAARKMTGFLSKWTLRELRVARYRFLTLRERAVTTSGAADVQVVTEIVRTMGGGR